MEKERETKRILPSLMIMYRCTPFHNAGLSWDTEQNFSPFERCFDSVSSTKSLTT